MSTVSNSSVVFFSIGRKLSTSHIPIFKASQKIARTISTFGKQCLNESTIIPFSIQQEKEKGRGFFYKENTYIHHSLLDHTDTAFFRITIKQLLLVDFFLLFLAIMASLDAHFTIIFFLGVVILLYFCDLFFNFFLIFISYTKNPEITVADDELRSMNTREWPKYTILCPLYKEWQILSQFIIAMSDIDYPKDKLQILLLLEGDDTETVTKISGYTLPYYFQTIIIPHSLPKTKPKALNYGLRFSKGEYLVVYDAEDIPDILQLKKAVIAFEKSEKTISCIQAKLNFYNVHQNLLTRLFTTEYTLWFDLVLTGLQSIRGPIPLGGTSNHFKTSRLFELKGWDSFNVTEDCDLGMRIAKSGYKTALINSTTYEESNSSITNWMKQRSRWIKGYIQTYLVHTRTSMNFLRKSSIKNYCLFHLIVGGKILSLFINPLMWILTVIYFLFRAQYGDMISSFFPLPILYTGVVCLIFGNFIYVYSYILGALKREQYDLVKYVFFIPFYWLCMSIAAWIAVYGIIITPHYWAKTQHGLHLEWKKKELYQWLVPSWIHALPVFTKSV